MPGVPGGSAESYANPLWPSSLPKNSGGPSAGRWLVLQKALRRTVLHEQFTVNIRGLFFALAAPVIKTKTNVVR